MADFSRFGAHLPRRHFSRFDPKVPHFSNKYPRVVKIALDVYGQHVVQRVNLRRTAASSCAQVSGRSVPLAPACRFEEPIMATLSGGAHIAIISSGPHQI